MSFMIKKVWLLHYDTGVVHSREKMHEKGTEDYLLNDL